MTEPKISMALDQTTLANAFAAMVLKELEGEQRDRILTQAIAFIIEPRKQQYGSTGPSFLEQAFNNAVATLTQKVAHEIVAADPAFLDAVRSEIHAAMAQVVENRSDLRSKIATALSEVW